MSEKLKNAVGALVQILHAEGLYARHPWLRAHVIAVERAFPAKTNELPPDVRDRLRALDDPAPPISIDEAKRQITALLGGTPEPPPALLTPYAVAIGNVHDGFTLFGPFRDRDHADGWADACEDAGTDGVTVVPLVSPR